MQMQSLLGLAPGAARPLPLSGRIKQPWILRWNLCSRIHDLGHVLLEAHGFESYFCRC